jgi:hypothetical protein
MVCSIFRHPHGNVSLRGTPTSFAWCFFMFFRSHHLETAECPEMSWMCYTFWGPIGWSSLMFLSNSLANSSQFLCECLVSSCVYFLAQCTKAARARHFTQPRQGRLWPNYTWPGQLTTNQGRLIPHKQIKHVHPDSKIIHQGLFTQIQAPRPSQTYFAYWGFQSWIRPARLTQGLPFFNFCCTIWTMAHWIRWFTDYCNGEFSCCKFLNCPSRSV